MFKKTLCITLMGISFFVFCYGDDRITVSTYYPSPYGSYRDLDANQMRIGATYATLPTAAPVNGLVVQGQVGIGTNVPTAGYALDVQGAGIMSGGLVSTTGYVYARNFYLYDYANWVTNLTSAPHSVPLYQCPAISPASCGGCIGQVSSSATCEYWYVFGYGCTDYGPWPCTLIGYTVP